MDIASSSKNDCYEIEVPLKLLQYLSSDNYNVHTLCRICLSERNSELIPLIATTNKLLQEMFTSITAIEVGTNDGLPKNVCDLCRTHIINCYEFKVLCEKSDCTLKSLIKGEFVTKEEKDATVRNETMQCNAEHIDDFEDIKREDLKDEVTDVQYLEGSSESDHEMLFIVQNSSDKDHLQIEETEITTTKDISKESKKKKHKIHVCTFCDKKFTSTKAVKSHMKRAHSSTSNSCSQCKESYQSQHDLKLHIPVHGAGPIWTCIECNKEFKGRSMLKRHIQRHMETKRYACETCGKPFAELYALRRHARVHTGERVEKRHACHLCDNRYSSRSQLAAHVTRHGAARPFKCDTCGKAFCSARLLASHGLVHDDYKPHHCNYCDKRFRHESTRNTHHRTHTGEKPYVCTTCGKRFIQNSNLTLHMRTHTGERPYSCKTCGRSFSSGSTLKSHIRTHTGDKPYQCPVCGKRFARMDLRAHMRQHTGERPFECSLCGRRFATAARVRDHHRIHTGEKPFECAHCSTKYTTKAHLVKHVKRHNKRRRAMQARRQTNDQRYSQVKVVTPDREIIDDHTSTLSTTIDVTTIDPKDLIITTAHDDNEVSGEIILESEDTQSGSLCLTSEVNSDMNYSSDMNVLTVNDGGVHIASSAAEGATVKLYQVDQSLLQIHSAGGQVTISKITSKMTANF